MKRRLLSCLGLATILMWPGPAALAEDTEKQLRDIQSKISKLQKQLSSKRDERSSVHNQLRDTEKRIGAIQKKIRSSQKQLDTQRGELQTLKQRRAELSGQLATQQELIKQQILEAYQMGQQKKLKMLLNQESPDKLSRALTYYDYFNRARSEQADTYLSNIAELDALRPAIEAKTEELEASHQVLARQRDQMRDQQNQREQTLARLDRDIGKEGKKLEQLGMERKELQKILQTLEEEVVNLELPRDYQPFGRARGKMHWPTKGNHLNRFGSYRKGSSLKWQGILIAASEGSDVKAIHHGRVVFADWLRGAGLLLIIDHGDGYMSLYGHNQSLLAETGDWINAGDVIATVGNSGGQQRAGLYFEIRRNGQPTDPRRWCRS